MNRRGNGLPARAWVALADVSARDADLALVVLGEAGVAAYAEAATGQDDDRTDRVFVDAAAAVAARSVLLQELPGFLAAPDASAPARPALAPGSDPDVDAAFAAIVAGLRATAPHMPDAAPDRPDDRPADISTVDDEGWPSPAEPVATDDEPVERFVPPPPPPLSEADLRTKLAWLGMLGAPGVLLGGALVGWSPGGWVVLALAAAFVAGFVTIVWGISERPEDDGDDGAVV